MAPARASRLELAPCQTRSSSLNVKGIPDGDMPYRADLRARVLSRRAGARREAPQHREQDGGITGLLASQRRFDDPVRGSRGFELPRSEVRGRPELQFGIGVQLFGVAPGVIARARAAPCSSSTLDPRGPSGRRTSRKILEGPAPAHPVLARGPAGQPTGLSTNRRRTPAATARCFPSPGEATDRPDCPAP